MTQEHKSTRHQSLSGYKRSIPAQGLCWLGSFSLLSSGFVYAQTEAAIDNIVPTTENVQPVNSKPVPSLSIERLKKTTPEASNPQVEFSQRRTRLRQRLNQNTATQLQKPITRLRERLVNQSPQQPKNTAPSRPLSSSAVTGNHDTRNVKPETSRISGNAGQPQSAPVIRSLRENPHADGENNPVSSNRESTRDYNNVYLDPTEYKIKPDTHLDRATPVVVRSRSGECRVLGANSSLCGKVPVVANTTKPAPTQKTNLPPTWIRKSENVRVATDNPIHPRQIALSKTRSATIAVNKPREIIPYTPQRLRHQPVRPEPPVTKHNPNRFIPAPSSFIPTPQTTVSSTPIAPKGGILPLPINAALTAPRPSQVTYDIPLASTLPQITYTAHLGTIANNPTGIIFPLSIPAPITSLFGWRTHPITGDRRFHSGTDIGAPIATPIVAAANGQVEIADYVSGYGLTVTLNHHNAQQTIYGHMSQIFVQPGQWVQQGAIIGLVGNTGTSTGPHLHFEVRQLTPNGWVAVDAGTQLQYSLGQMTQMLRAAQVHQSLQGE